MENLIKNKKELIEKANAFLELFDEETCTEEMYMFMQNQKIDKRTITYLGELVMSDENLINSYK